MMRAIKTRGFVPKTRMHTYKTYAYLIGMIFVRSTDRAQRVHQAMICRGFDGHFHSLVRFSMKKPDYTALPFMVAALAGLEVLEWISRL
jgi:cobalt/nickel transport system permease protein